MTHPTQPARRARPVWPRLMAATLVVIATQSLLAGCAPLLIGGAILGGSMVVTDRRSSGTQLDDQAIELKAINRIAETLGDRGHINVTRFNRQVLFTGEVATEGDKARVEQALARIENVRTVVNELAVAAASSLASRSNDALLTGKVKASLVDARDLQVNAFKVVTERGVVYLMGTVTEREATRAAEVARGVSGVRKVVRVFEVVSEAELAASQAKAAALP